MLCFVGLRENQASGVFLFYSLLCTANSSAQLKVLKKIILIQ